MGPEAEESKAGLKQEVSEPEEESKVPKEEMPYVEKLENELVPGGINGQSAAGVSRRGAVEGHAVAREC